MFTMCHYERKKNTKKQNKKQKKDKKPPEWAVDNCFGGSS